MNGNFSGTEKTQFAGGINFHGWIVSSTNHDSWNRDNIFANVNLIQNSLNQNQLAIINTMNENFRNDATIEMIWIANYLRILKTLDTHVPRKKGMQERVTSMNSTLGNGMYRSKLRNT